ncbi:MAG: mannose-6-phosphate isomerase, class I, partial [Victivallales bacterium]|nr:mannose-6-phosphate isomerase, class I [Victivallales bacterium]
MSFQKLICPVQHYPWGEKPSAEHSPYIPRLLGQSPGTVPWAELWIGSHPQASSVVADTGETLLAQIQRAPLANLGARLAEQGTLPYLLKVLCCDEPLSIQSHPDQKTAERYHRLFPQDFPDGNHKPEIIYALTVFRAMAGFRSLEDILSDLRRHPALSPWADALPGHPGHREICSFLLNATPSLLQQMESRLQAEALTTDSDRLFALLASRYPGDCGIFFAYLLNQVALQPGQAIFVQANMPHAYLCGEGVECMANSNNVIRAGLTHKTIRKDLLLESLDFREHPVASLLVPPAQQAQLSCDFACADFRIRIFGAGITVPMEQNTPAVLLILSGEAELRDSDHCITAT